MALLGRALAGWLALLPELEILRSVVISNPVLVVDVLALGERASEHLFHDEAVLQNAALRPWSRLTDVALIRQPAALVDLAALCLNRARLGAALLAVAGWQEERLAPFALLLNARPPHLSPVGSVVTWTRTELAALAADILAAALVAGPNDRSCSLVSPAVVPPLPSFVLPESRRRDYLFHVDIIQVRLG